MILAIKIFVSIVFSASFFEKNFVLGNNYVIFADAKHKDYLIWKELLA
jgi:hypothetical protein